MHVVLVITYLASQINHFPGNGVFTSKVELAGSLSSDFHPSSFRLPKEADRFKDVVRVKHIECSALHVYPLLSGMWWGVAQEVRGVAQK